MGVHDVTLRRAGESSKTVGRSFWVVLRGLLASCLTGGGLALASFHFSGQWNAQTIIAATAILWASHLGGMALRRRSDDSFSGYFAAMMAVGYSALVMIFAAALAVPSLYDRLIAMAEFLPLPALSSADIPNIVELGFVYVFCLIVFSLFAPVSLILFRYTSR